MGALFNATAPHLLEIFVRHAVDSFLNLGLQLGILFGINLCHQVREPLTQTLNVCIGMMSYTLFGVNYISFTVILHNFLCKLHPFWCKCR